MAWEQLGEARTGEFSVPGGKAQLYERGAVVTGAAGAVMLTFTLPMIGQPSIATGSASSATALEAPALTFQVGAWTMAALLSALQGALADRLALLPTGIPGNAVPIDLGVPVVVVAAGPGAQPIYGVPATASLSDRQLYDIAIRADDGQWRVVAPHALYYRSAWHDFGVAHVTDIHCARRIDGFADKLEQAGRSADTLINWNDRFRGFVRYANYLHSTGVLDVILATGDILDYLYEDDDEPGGGNALFIRDLLLGRSATVRFADVEELKLPIFMVPGNHEYRKNAYRLVFNLDLGLPGNARQLRKHAGFRMNWHDAVAIDGRDGNIASLSADTAKRFIEIDEKITPFKTHLVRDLNYIVRLGDHRIVMLDSGWDVDLPQNKPDLLWSALGWASEDMKAAIDGGPNSRGVAPEWVARVEQTLADMPANGLAIVGLHAPLFNPFADEYPFFLRETQRKDLPEQAYGWLARHDDRVATLTVAGQLPDDRVPATVAALMRQHHPDWFAAHGDPTAVNYLKRGSPADLLDAGVSRGQRPHDLLEILAGLSRRRAADVVLHGHIHRYIDFRVGRSGDQLTYHMDSYTGTLAHYYPATFVSGWDGAQPVASRTYVETALDAPANNRPCRVAYDTTFEYAVSVPPYPRPLAAAADPRAWWAEHRPLVLQTEALGPFQNADANLAGFRVLSVKADVIRRIEFVSIEALHASNYSISWEKVTRPDPMRSPGHAQRSREYDMAPARGDPRGYSLSSSQVQNIVYRDAQGRLMELWRDASGRRGYGDLTTAAPANAARAHGDPSPYFDNTVGMVIAPYRGADGHVHSIYWAPAGAVGHDALSGPVHAPAAAGNPVGFYNERTTVHHVIYRSVDRHLQALYWKGQEAVRCEALTNDAEIKKAAGNPAPYLDTRRDVNTVVYRAVDNHVRSVYWSNGPFRADDLSGVAGAADADGDPVAYFLAGPDLHQVFYRSANGHIHELWWKGTEPVRHQDLTDTFSAPLADSDPSAWFSSIAKRKHVAYRSADGHVHDLSWSVALGGQSPKHVDLSVDALAAAAEGAPFGFSGPTQQHVVYRGADHQIHELRWQERASTPIVPR